MYSNIRASEAPGEKRSEIQGIGDARERKFGNVRVPERLGEAETRRARHE